MAEAVDPRWYRWLGITALIVVIPISLPVWAWVGGWFVFQALGTGGIVGDENVAHWAHIGGFVAGLLFIPLMKHDEAKLFARPVREDED